MGVDPMTLALLAPRSNLAELRDQDTLYHLRERKSIKPHISHTG
jgi:hypothetical protein